MIRRDYGRRPSTQAQPQRAVPQHKYRIGQAVKFFSTVAVRTSRTAEKAMREGDFEITRLLPKEDADFQYRIKDARTGHERVVAESEISLV